jgi:hypothetical protein
MGLGSGIRKRPIPDPGAKKAPDPGSGSATLIKRFKGKEGKRKTFGQYKKIRKYENDLIGVSESAG